MLLTAFPDDDRFWLVKWIDRFRQHAAGSRSVAVDVLLEALPVTSEREVANLSVRQVASWVGKAWQQEPRPVATVPIGVGLLPDVSLGQVYHHQELIGWLPVERRSVPLDHADQDAHAIRLTTKLTPPAGWPSKHYGWLNHFEYHLIGWNSRLLVLPHRDIDFLIPRTVVFRWFYAPTGDLANALTHGPWSTTASEVLFLDKQMGSGLQTRKNPATGAYEVIVQEGVRNEYAWLLALLYHDPYARACAERLHTESVIERAGSALAPWHANARIPVVGTTTAPLTLQVEGWPLRTTANPHARQRFLVTAIPDCTPPGYLPPIAFERVNSNQTGMEISGTFDRQPYAHARAAYEAAADLTVSSHQDAHGGRPTAHARGVGFAWSHLPVPTKLTKLSSKTFDRTILPPRDAEEPTTASPNDPAHGAGLPNQLRSEAISRDPVKRFDHLMAALARLASQVTTTVVPPSAPWQRTQRGDLHCWSFRLTPDGRRRRTPWEVIEKADGRGLTFRPALPRAALVLQLTSATASAYWIEIETRATESYVPVLMTTDGGIPSVCAAMAAIVQGKGTHLHERVSVACHGLATTIRTPRHHYLPGSETKVDPTWVERQLAAIGIRHDR